MTDADRIRVMWPAMVEQAIAAYPREMCGVLLCRAGQTISRQLGNVAEGEHRFLAEPRDLYEVEMELERPDTLLVATVHSHPSSGPWLSADDYHFALMRREAWHVIVGRRMEGDATVGDPTHEGSWLVRSWRVQHGSLQFHDVPA